ncbi:MAG: CotH kinase family protein [Saprospiraceae bacterium]|nr:CotH kinase family protein [Saprospiraceae bacterium]
MATLHIVSCKKDPDVKPGPPTITQENAVDTIVPTGNEQYLTKGAEFIFDQNQLHTFEINLPAFHFKKLNDDPAAEEYVAGSLTFDGETISPIGIRYKGSIGAFVGCLSGTDWGNPSGHKVCTKLSMQLKMNWLDADAKFYGLKKIQLHSMNQDDSQMRERLAFWLFRAMGVPAPRSVHARVVINGQYVGLFALTEEVDGRFARQNFEDGTGNVYKEIWPVDMNGLPFSEQSYLSHLETNEDENPTASRIRGFAQAVANAPQNNLKQVIADWMKIDEIIAYAVVDRTIRVDDGPFHWYCWGGNCSSHNFYWYEEPTEGTLHLIPWDMDNAFENIISNENPVIPIADAWGETRNNCQPFPFGSLQFMQRSAACDKLTAGWASFEEEYAEKLLHFKTTVLAPENIDPLLDAWERQIMDATSEADAAYNDAVTVYGWQSALDKLKAQVEHARTH